MDHKTAELYTVGRNRQKASKQMSRDYLFICQYRFIKGRYGPFWQDTNIIRILARPEKIFFQENVWEKVWTFLHGLKRNVPIVKMLKKANFLSQVLKFFIEDTSYRRSDQKFNEIKSGSVRISQDQSGSVRISQDQSGSGTTTLTETVTQIPRSSFNAGPGWPQQRK
jgi:hypothetical protein